MWVKNAYSLTQNARTKFRVGNYFPAGKEILPPSLADKSSTTLYPFFEIAYGICAQGASMSRTPAFQCVHLLMLTVMKPTVYQAVPTVVLADLNEILFENLEHHYGAYVLRRDGNRYLLAALGFCLAVVCLGIGTPALLNRLREPSDKLTQVKLTTILIDPVTPDQKEKVITPPEPERPKQAMQQRTIAVLIPNPKPVEDILKEAEVMEVDSLNRSKAAIGLVNRDGADPEGFFLNMDPGEADGPAILAEDPRDKEPADSLFQLVTDEPRTINLDDIRKLIGYPQIARDAGIEGMVVLRVLIDERGNYVRHKIIKQAHPILAEACESKVNRLKFTPAIQGSRAIKFWVNVPFNFKLVH